MLRTLLARAHQGHRTIPFPKGAPALSDRFRGLPTIGSGACPEGCRACSEACPTEAIAVGDEPRVDLGRCLFCADCARVCPEARIAFSGEFRLATRRRDDLLAGSSGLRLAGALEEKSRRLFGRSLRLRQVSAGGCNACEADAAVLQTVVFDFARFGIGFVASPRHADGLLVTGPVTENMREALLKTHQAMPSPKLVIASGACAISGGPFAGHPEVHNGVGDLLPVDLFVPGCPPHPLTLLDGLLRLLGRIG
jgi:Ni,Fe-hydrogenase III small subunit/formate hydrogenlyase subunit 6/NADH:ubiquinone oxidoreductase subunit I